MKADWVYRGDQVDNEGAAYRGLSTYSAASVALSTGESAGHILYDSKNYLRQIAGNSETMNTTGRAAGSKPKMIRVQGMLKWEASVWATGDDLQIAFRIGVFQQDSLDGFLQVDVNYTMMNLGLSVADNVDIWANQPRANLWEQRVYQHFATGNESSVRSLYVNASMKGVRLNDDECLGLYVEMGQASEGMRYYRWLRTLVQDEGSG